MNLPERYVFVYGTLRRGQANDINRLCPAPRFVSMARIDGAMYDLGDYPGVLFAGHGLIVGEVYAITPALERVLDRIEEVHPQGKDEYVKRWLRIGLRGLELDCLVYEINPAYIQGRPVIACGDWAQREMA